MTVKPGFSGGVVYTKDSMSVNDGCEYCINELPGSEDQSLGVST